MANEQEINSSAEQENHQASGEVLNAEKPNEKISEELTQEHLEIEVGSGVKTGVQMIAIISLCSILALLLIYHFLKSNFAQPRGTNAMGEAEITARGKNFSFNELAARIKGAVGQGAESGGPDSGLRKFNDDDEDDENLINAGGFGVIKSLSSKQFKNDESLDLPSDEELNAAASKWLKDNKHLISDSRTNAFKKSANVPPPFTPEQQAALAKRAAEKLKNGLKPTVAERLALKMESDKIKQELQAAGVISKNGEELALIDGGAAGFGGGAGFNGNAAGAFAPPFSEAKMRKLLASAERKIANDLPLNAEEELALAYANPQPKIFGANGAASGESGGFNALVFKSGGEIRSQANQADGDEAAGGKKKAAKDPLEDDYEQIRVLNEGIEKDKERLNYILATGKLPEDMQPAQSKAEAEKAKEKENEQSAFKPVVAQSSNVNPHFLLKQGTLIHCSLDTKINSQLGGFLRCTIKDNVYSADGALVLLDRGSTLYGQFGAGAISDDINRLYITWTEARTPQNILIPLGDAPATDALGATGAEGYVDNRYLKRFGAGIFLSVLDDAVSLALNKGGGEEDKKDSRDDWRSYSATRESARDMANTALNKFINIRPVLYKNQGELISVYVNRDVDFSGVYSLKLRRAK